MRKLKAGVLLALFTLALSGTAQAAMIAEGSTLVKSGNFIPVDAAGNPTTLDLAVGFDFTTLVAGDTATPGVDGEFIITTATGDFTPLLFSVGDISDFLFGAPAIAGFPNVPIVSFETVGIVFSFDLETISVMTQNGNFLNLIGTGTFFLAGFDPTPGVISLTGTTIDGFTFGFSANQGVQVPEPASMALFGLGVLGVGFMRRRSVLEA